VGDLLVAPYNDLATAERLIADRARELAAVILDPVQRAILADPAFVRGLRAVTARCGVPLVFDEVVSGFRIALGGAVEHYGVVPDLVAFGKALGGGAPVAVVGGRAGSTCSKPPARTTVCGPSAIGSVPGSPR